MAIVVTVSDERPARLAVRRSGTCRALHKHLLVSSLFTTAGPVGAHARSRSGSGVLLNQNMKPWIEKGARDLRLQVSEEVSIAGFRRVDPPCLVVAAAPALVIVQAFFHVQLFHGAENDL